ncbi:MAG: hypothetical protein N2Z80_04820 [Hydrogenothermaceae bacterium]|nr:hypothetical protein [Hydrogenothermaceae bacterium]
MLVSIILVGLLYFDKKSKEKFYLNKKLEKLEAGFFITTDKFDKISDITSKIKIKKDLITSTLYTKDFMKRYIIFNAMCDDFRILKSYGCKDVLFVLPDGRLFLSMESPGKYGKRIVD